MSTQNQLADSNRKRVIGTSMAVFLAVMLILTFFSNTINNFTAPRVSVKHPASGQIVKEISAQGSVYAKNMVEEYVQSEMKVLETGVKPGDAVKKGQVLLTLDTGDIEKQLINETAVYQQKKLTMEKHGEDLSDVGMFSYDKAIETAKVNMDKARQDYENKKLLLEAGGETRVNVEDAEKELKKAELEHKAALNSKEKGINSSRRELENAQYDLGIEERKIADLKKQLALKTIKSPIDGIVAELNFSKGETADKSKPLYKLAEVEKGFQFYASVDSKAATVLAPGDAAYVTVDALGETIEGEIAEIVDDPEKRGKQKILHIDIPADGLSGGETGSADIRKATKTYDVLVPNSAVGQDISGYFAYVIREAKGPLGNETYVQRIKISAGESDYQNTGITSGISSFDNVIVSSDKPVSDGTHVIVNK